MEERQKIKLCYTVTFDEVPDEISKFLQKSLDLNKQIVTNLEVAKRKASINNIQFSLNSIHEARIELIKMDQVLDDVVELLTGYGQALENLQQEGLKAVAETVETLKQNDEENDEEA